MLAIFLSRVRMLTLLAILFAMTLGFIPVQAQSGDNAYTDPQERYTFPVPADWTVAAGEDDIVRITDPDGNIQIYILVVKGNDTNQAITDGWTRVAPDIVFVPQQSIEPPSNAGVEKTVVETEVDQNTNRIFQGVGQLVKGDVYLFLIDADLVAATQRSAQINIIASGFTITGLKVADLSTATPAKINQSITDHLETYLTTVMEKLYVPGAAVAIVQDGKIVYEKGFGVRQIGTNDPVTPDTRMMIGSTGKSLTTLMMATLVDDGLMTWDEKVIDILPNFAVKDPDRTQKITVRNLVCACTGVPRRDLEFIFNAAHLSAEDIITSLKDFEFFTDFGEAFQYSNQMVATGGYAATVAAGGKYGNLYNDYVSTMQKRVFDPLAMTRTTFSFDEVVADSNHATPHGAVLTGGYVPLSLSEEKVLVPVTPAGADWSTAHDMARYMLTEINKGLTPEGQRIVSEANLLETWKPQVQVTAETSYGLGWFIDQYKGVKLIHHAGNTLGFTSDFAFLPDAGLGIVILTNAQATNLFNEAIRYRLLELVYDQPMEYDPTIDFALQQIAENQTQIQEQLRSLDETAIKPYLGTFKSDVLGEADISLVDSKLMMDVGEFSTELRPIEDGKGRLNYVMMEPPLAGSLLQFKLDDAGQPTIEINLITDLYTFTKVT
ncbi:MAG: serine hydrolase domain-containing protein [Anaerolineae bacterium]